VAQTIVVVTFYSRGGTTERLATAAAVGAVQMRAGIRMRRVPDADPAAALAALYGEVGAVGRDQATHRVV